MKDIVLECTCDKSNVLWDLCFCGARNDSKGYFDEIWELLKK